jgi:hypothetical protein
MHTAKAINAPANAAPVKAVRRQGKIRVEVEGFTGRSSTDLSVYQPCPFAQ